MACKVRSLLIWSIPFFLLSLSALAQTGTFTGQVTDATQAVLPGTEVTLVNLDTGESRTVITGDNGFYRATNMSRANYELSAALDGFKTLIRKDIELTVGEIKRVDFALDPGAKSIRINVSGQAPLVNTEEGRISTLIAADQIENLPLNGRNVFTLALTQPGMVDVAALGFQSVTSSFSAQGNRHRATNFMLDGTDINRPGIGGEPALIPVQDAVEEFRLSTTNFSPEFGRNAGAVVNVVTKSGSNEFHGSVWEYHRNSALDAREFTDSDKAAPLIQNWFGFTVGGPVKKNKAWFFGYYEGQRHSFTENQSFQTEAPQFAAALMADPLLGGTQAAELLRRHPSLALPNSVSLTSGEFVDNIVSELGPTFGSGFGGNWFADWDGDGDVDRQDTAVAAGFWEGAIGLALAPGQVARIGDRTEAFWNLLKSNPDLPLLGNASFGPRTRASNDQYSLRMDTEFNEGRDRLFGRWTQELNGQNLFNNLQAATRRGILDPLDGDAHNLALVHTHTFSPRVINEARTAWSKTRVDFLAEPNALPEIFIVGPAEINPFGASADSPQLFTEHTFQYEDTLSINWGSHGLQMGGEIRRNVENGVFDVSTRGSFYFYGLGEFVLDEPTFQFSAFDPEALAESPSECVQSGLNCNWEFPDMHRGFRNYELGFFLSDDWKIAPRFTLNWGFRYDLYGAPTEIQDRLSNLRFGSGSDIFERVATAPRFDPLGVKTGQVQFNPGFVSSVFAGDHNNWSPRLGFAWDPFGDGKTSVRGGYSVGYDRLFFNITSNIRFNPPTHAFGIFGSFLGNNISPSYDIDEKANRLPGEGSPPSFFSSSRISLRTPDPNIRTSYVQNGFFGIQREILGDFILDANYVTSLGRKLSLIEDYNRFAGDRFGATDPFGLDRPGDRSQTRLHPDFTAINFRGNHINSAYHAAQLQIRKRFGHGYAFQASYTFSKLIDSDSDVLGARGVDDIYTVDAMKTFLDRGLSVLDIANRFTANSVWEIPFLKRQTGIVGKALGGWQVNTSLVLQDGRPFSPQIPDNLGNGDFAGRATRPNDRPSSSFDRSLDGNDRAEFQRDAAGPSPCSITVSGEGTIGSVQTINPGCSAGLFRGKGFTSVLGENGKIGRNTFRGPGFVNVDFSVFKNIAVQEQVRLQVRAEFFNLFNRVNLHPTPEPEVNNPFFGTVGSQFDAREIQFALKLLF